MAVQNVCFWTRSTFGDQFKGVLNQLWPVTALKVVTRLKRAIVPPREYDRKVGNQIIHMKEEERVQATTENYLFDPDHKVTFNHFIRETSKKVSEAAQFLCKTAHAHSAEILLTFVTAKMSHVFQIGNGEIALLCTKT